MKPFARKDLEVLVDRPETTSVSIYLPTERAGREVRQNAIRFKNLLRTARSRLSERRRLPDDEIDAFLAPASRLLGDEPFWQHQQDGLAYFLAADGVLHYRVPLRFPAELAIVGGRFHIKPLLALLTGDGLFHLLALNRKRIALYRCTRESIDALETGDMPTSYLDVVGRVPEEQHLQFHTGAGAAGGGSGERAAMYHGQGGGDDDVEPEVRRFLTIVDRHVRGILGDDGTPLVVAGDDPLLSLYREVNGHTHTPLEMVRANPASLSEDELHRRAWELVEPVFARSRAEAASRFGALLPEGRASDHLKEIVAASAESRVDVLFVRSGVQCWGRFDPQRRFVRLADRDGEGRQDLLDLAAAQTLRHGGTVFVAGEEEMPSRRGPIAALFRY